MFQEWRDAIDFVDMAPNGYPNCWVAYSSSEMLRKTIYLELS